MGLMDAISAAEYPIGIYRPPLAFIYALQSLAAALTYGAAAIPSGFVTAYNYYKAYTREDM